MNYDAEARASLRERARAIGRAYDNAGLGDDHRRLLLALVVETNISAAQASTIFAALLEDRRRGLPLGEFLDRRRRARISEEGAET